MPSTLQNFQKREAQIFGPEPKGGDFFNDIAVSVQVIYTYHVTVDAETPEEAVEQVRALTSEQIKEEGSLQSIDVDHIEAI